MLAKKILLNGTQKSVLANEDEEIVRGYLKISLPHQAFILIAMFVVSLGLGGPTRRPVLSYIRIAWSHGTPMANQTSPAIESILGVWLARSIA